MQGRSHTLQNAHFSKKFSIIYKGDLVIKLLFITETKSYYFVQPSTYIYSRTSRCCIIKTALYIPKLMESLISVLYSLQYNDKRKKVDI